MIASTLKELLNTHSQQGEVVWIGLRPTRRASMLSVNEARVSPEKGLEGDRYGGRSGISWSAGSTYLPCETL
jgi:hypothetical protein